MPFCTASRNAARTGGVSSSRLLTSVPSMSRARRRMGAAVCEVRGTACGTDEASVIAPCLGCRSAGLLTSPGIGHGGQLHHGPLLFLLQESAALLHVDMVPGEPVLDGVGPVDCAFDVDAQL